MTKTTSNGHSQGNGAHHEYSYADAASPSPQQQPATLSPMEERVRKLAQPPPTSFTLTAALQLLQTPRRGDSVYLMDPEYLQRWLDWAYHQPIGPSSTGDTNSDTRNEEARVQEAVRLAAVQLGLVPPTSSTFDETHNNDHSLEDLLDAVPGPIDSTILSVQGHPRLLSPFVKVWKRHPNQSQQSLSVMTTNRGRLHRANSKAITDVDAALEYHPKDNGDGSSSNATIYCVAVPEAFYETLRTVHGVICDDGRSVSMQVAETERRPLLHHQRFHQHHPPTALQSSTARIHDLARPIEFRRKLIWADPEETKSETDADAQKSSANAVASAASSKADKDPQQQTSLMDKLLAEEARRKQPTIRVEVHPLKLVYSILDATEATTSEEEHDATKLTKNLSPSGFVLVSRETSAVDALLALMRVAVPNKATEAVRLWSKPQYDYNPPMEEIPKGRGPERPTALGDDYELLHLQSLENDRISLQDWTDRQLRKTHAQNKKSRSPLQVQVLVEAKKKVHSDWLRSGLELEERIQVGDFVDAQDIAGKWYEAVVRNVDDVSVTVHYIGWASRWDARIKRRRNQPGMDGIPNKIQPPCPLWTRTERWRERVRVGDIVEIRDSSSIVERPKWYRGEVKKVGTPQDKVREIRGGAELEKYSIAGDDSKKEMLIIMNRMQQILVEVEQEKSQKAGSISASLADGDLEPRPPFLRWVNLFGEEVCKLGTHLKADDGRDGPVTLRYEYDGNRKPVEVMKSHPAHGSGFLRESLRGTPPAPGSVGLHNLGNSCFLNSTLQCLNHLEPLTQYFLQDRHDADLNRKNPLGSGGNVALAYASLLKKIWSGEYSTLAPRMLKQTVASFAPQFDNSYQHDSQEFCQFLMDGLHEDLNRVTTKPYVEELECFGMDDDKAAIESWRKHLLRHDSIIVDHCQGMHRSHLTCPRCGRESIKFDVFSSISLPLAVTKRRSTIRLEDCLEQFMEGEQLDERNAWYCPNCRQHVCALKMIALWSVPDVLILHLKRFTFDTCMTSGGMLRSKMDDTVEFPVERFDITKHVLGPIDPDAPPVYRLFGVSEHTGPTANSGHYTATVRNSIDSQWYRYNDSHVGRTSGEASITGGAYLLFYQRAKGISKWGGMYKVMKERSINPYGGLETDQEGFKRVKNKKKKKP